MNMPHHRSAHAGRLAVFGAASLCGVAILFAQGQGGAKPAKPAQEPRSAKPAPAADAPENSSPNQNQNANAARRRGHGLGFDVAGQGDQGLRVSAIDDKGPAAQAGLKANDRIVSVDGRPFTRGRQLQAYLSGQGGRQVPIVIDRGGQQLTVQFTPAAFDKDSAWLGVYLEEGDANMKGARITHVYPAGPAARAGLYAGDIVTRIAGQDIDGSADLVATIQQMEPKKQVEFQILRNEREQTVPVILGSRDAFAARRFERNDSGNHNESAHIDHDDFDDVPAYAMHLEHDRRAAEQHQRIEQEIRLLREEIAKLREELTRK